MAAAIGKLALGSPPRSVRQFIVVAVPVAAVSKHCFYE